MRFCEASKTPSPFDVKTIKYLVGLMGQHDLSEIDLRDGNARLRLRRGPRRVTTTTTPIVAAPVAAGPPAALVLAMVPFGSTHPVRDSMGRLYLGSGLGTGKIVR